MKDKNRAEERSSGVVSQLFRYMNLKRYFILLLCLSLLCAPIFGMTASADDSVIVRVGIYENSPKIFTDETGKASGFWPDIIEYIASEEGWEIEYIPGTWEECLRRLGQNEIDIMPDVAYTEERGVLYDFSNETVYTSWSWAYTREGTDIQSILDLEGKNIAVLKGSINFEGPEGIKELVNAFDLNCTFTEVDSYTRVFELVESGEADVGVTSKDFGNQHETDFDVAKTAIIFQPAPLYFAFPKDSALKPYPIDRIDSHMKELKANGDSIYYQSLERWFAVKSIEKPVVPGWVKWVLIGIGCVVFVLVGGNRLLTSRVRSKTKELTEEINERKQAEERFKTIFDNAKDGILLAEIESKKFIAGNKAICDMLGYSAEEIKNLGTMDIHPEESLPHVIEQFEKQVRQEIVLAMDIPLKRKDGSVFYTDVNSTPITIAGEEFLLGNFRDITEHKQVERELSLRAELLDNANDAIFMHTLDGEFIYVNTTACQSLGYSKDELLKVDLSAITAPGVGAETQWKQLLEKGQAAFESAQLRKDGSVMAVEVHARSIEVGNDKSILSVVRDITERKKAEEDLRKSEMKYSALVERSNDGIVILQGGSLIFTNAKILEMAGFSAEEIAGKSFIDFVSPEYRELVADRYKRRASGEKVPDSYEIELIAKDGSKIPVEISASIISYEEKPADMVIIRDITERKKASDERRELEKRVQLSDRLASIGEMASGIAHEINNPLTSVVGFSELLLEKDLPDDIREGVGIIYDGSQRVVDIVKGRLTFAHQHKSVRNRTDFNEIIKSTLTLRRYSLETGNIKVNTSLDAELPWTVVDAGQLQQVFMNIIVNAETEMKKAHGRGKLTIKTEQAGNNIRISFADDGPGIAKENIGKVFDPFFTTKEVGEGTGLGLSLSYGIIREHKGRIYAESEAGEGATFIIELPILAEEEEKIAQVEAVEEDGKPHGGRILVVDDEPAILTFLKKVLVGEGYDVVTAGSGKEALEKIRSEEYGLILSDIKMPGLSGVELYDEIGKTAPSLQKRIMFITGDVISADTKEFLKRARAPYVTKPFDIAGLKREVRRVLNGII